MKLCHTQGDPGLFFGIFTGSGQPSSNPQPTGATHIPVKKPKNLSAATIDRACTCVKQKEAWQKISFGSGKERRVPCKEWRSETQGGKEFPADKSFPPGKES